MVSFADWTPEQRAAAVAKANETRARKRAESVSREEGVEAAQERGRTARDRAPASAPTRAPARGGRPPGGSKATSLDRIESGLAQTFTMAGLGVSMIDPWDGQVIALNAQLLARSWRDLAADNATVRKALERILAGSAWGQAIGSTAMVALPILAHHRSDLVPPGALDVARGAGVTLPDAGARTQPRVHVERAAPHPSTPPETAAPSGQAEPSGDVVTAPFGAMSVEEAREAAQEAGGMFAGPANGAPGG